MKKSTLCLFFSALTLMLLSSAAFAELAYIDPVTNQGVLDQVSQKFFNKAKSWHTALESAAIRLFWTLVLISMVWTFGMMALRKADILQDRREGRYVYYRIKNASLLDLITASAVQSGLSAEAVSTLISRQVYPSCECPHCMPALISVADLKTV